MWKKIILAGMLLCALCFTGCINGRIWGDNFLRGWFRGNIWKNTVDQNASYTTTIQGIPGSDIARIVIVAMIPMVFVAVLGWILYGRSLRKALAVLVMLIEQCESSDEMKRISSLISRSNKTYRIVINRELRKIR